MEPTAQVFWLPKEGYSAEEYEDAFSCSENEGLIAIADGATESSFADLWAQSLVNKFTKTPPPITAPPVTADVENWLTPLQKEWHASIAWDRLPWYAEEKARNGAFATMLGLRLQINDAVEPPSIFQKLFSVFSKPKPDGKKWQAIAVGDSNLFQIRDNQLVKCFPLQKAAEFDSRPVLLGSNPKLNQIVWTHVKVVEDFYQPQDEFILCTDALAKWFLARFEAGEKPWRTLKALKSDQDFATFVGELRKKSAIRNDDTTAIILSWPAGAKT